MDELRRIVREYLNGPHSTAAKEVVDYAYHLMGHDKDGLVSFHAFSDYMKKIRRRDLGKRALFNKLDSDGDEKLNWDDVATLVYVVWSGHRICQACGCFIEGRFFTCATCFLNNEHPYVLCLACHRKSRKISDYVHHEHNDFFDNVLLLESLRMGKLTRKASNQASMARSSASSSTAIVKASKAPPRPEQASKPRTRSQASSSKVVDGAMTTQKPPSTAVVVARNVPPRPEQFHWRDALNIIGIGVSAAGFFLSQQCSIM